MAKNLNISLGLVNSFIKRLAHKGYFKITNIPANRVKYILTPNGAAEKSRLTYEYIRYSFQLYKIAREKLRFLIADLEKKGVRRLAFYGAGDLAEIAYLSLQESSIEFVAVVDEEKKGEKFLGYTVEDPSRLQEFEFDRLLLTDIALGDNSPVELEKLGMDLKMVVRIQ